MTNPTHQSESPFRPMLVHILHAGQALCGRDGTHVPPFAWHWYEQFVSLDEASKSNCLECERAVALLFGSDERRWITCPLCKGSGEVVREDYKPGDYFRVDCCGKCEGMGNVNGIETASLDLSARLFYRVSQLLKVRSLLGNATA